MQVHHISDIMTKLPEKCIHVEIANNTDHALPILTHSNVVEALGYSMGTGKTIHGAH
jgi:hypothetical protein